MKTVKFVAVERDGRRDGTYGYSVEVDGVKVIEHIRSSDMDMADASLDPVWKALGVTIDFDWE